MRGKLFQFIWHFMVKGFIKRKNGVGDNLKDYSERMIEQLKLALNFTDKIDFVIIGDSNGENLATYSNMVQLQKEIGGIGVNIAIGGTRADTWNEFLRFSHKGGDIRPRPGNRSRHPAEHEAHHPRENSCDYRSSGDGGEGVWKGRENERYSHNCRCGL